MVAFVVLDLVFQCLAKRLAMKNVSEMTYFVSCGTSDLKSFPVSAGWGQCFEFLWLVGRQKSHLANKIPFISKGSVEEENQRVS